ncbi:hypothetical protein EYF80_015249 [Liparis tanakae]|uniref:Uncharacterized protein n=1 Tax=Liparis tanakae TaxID=230148 RepID=A0A4Z2I8R6_9TELE|nr:hypothetical protein EYF80_015249 [Liparis tanakae]
MVADATQRRRKHEAPKSHAAGRQRQVLSTTNNNNNKAQHTPGCTMRKTRLISRRHPVTSLSTFDPPLVHISGDGVETAWRRRGAPGDAFGGPR